jgi:hypothetical protein
MLKLTLLRIVTMVRSFILVHVMVLLTFGQSTKVKMVENYTISRLFKVVRFRLRVVQSRPLQLFHQAQLTTERWSYMVELTKYCAFIETRKAGLTLMCSLNLMMKPSDRQTSIRNFNFMFFVWLTQE